MTQSKLAIRVREKYPAPPLWNNNGAWWCDCTEYLPYYTKRRETGFLPGRPKDPRFSPIRGGTGQAKQAPHNPGSSLLRKSRIVEGGRAIPRAS